MICRKHSRPSGPPSSASSGSASRPAARRPALSAEVYVRRIAHDQVVRAGAGAPVLLEDADVVQPQPPQVASGGRAGRRAQVAGVHPRLWQPGRQRQRQRAGAAAPVGDAAAAVPAPRSPGPRSARISVSPRGRRTSGPASRSSSRKAAPAVIRRPRSARRARPGAGSGGWRAGRRRGTSLRRRTVRPTRWSVTRPCG